MRVTDFQKEGSDGRLVLTGMIVSSQVLGAISARWNNDGLFDSIFLDRIGDWCVRHWKKFGKAPGKQILSYHRRWSESRRRPTDEDKQIDSFLGSLSEEYIRRESKTIQADYIIQTATDLFTDVAARRAMEQAQDFLSNGKRDKAVEILSKVGKVDMTTAGAVNILEDKAAVRTAFKEASEPLIVYPGAAGFFFRNRLKRRAFVAFEGPEKRGKSFWLLDVAWRAFLQKRKVYYFELGDMPQEDLIMRFAARATKKPVDPAELEDNGLYRYPISLQPVEGTGKCEVIHDERRITEKMNWKEAYRSFQLALKKYDGLNRLKVSCHSARSLSVPQVVQKLEELKHRENWIPDVCVFDYADLFSPVNGTADTRDQINLTWILLRALSTQWNCLVVTATQASRASYNAELIEMDHTSDDKRKLGHATMFVGINQSDQEKDQGIYRLNIPVARQGVYNKKRVLTTAGCLAVASPCIRSVYI